LPGARLLWGSSGEGSGSVMELVEWPEMEESGGETCGGKFGFE
nr:hypothetical protein [Tanacetum cinerariifolium]